MALRLRTRFGDGAGRAPQRMALKDSTSSPSRRRNSSLTVDYGVRSRTPDRRPNEPEATPADSGDTASGKRDSNADGTGGGSSDRKRDNNADGKTDSDHQSAQEIVSRNDDASDNSDEDISDEEYDRRCRAYEARAEKYSARLRMLSGHSGY